MPEIRKSYQEQWHIRTLAYRLADAIAILCGWLLASRVVFSWMDLPHSLVVTLSILTFHFVGEITGMYRNWRGIKVDREVMCIVLTWFISAPIVLSISLMRELAPAFLVMWLVSSVMLMVAIRVTLRSIQSWARKQGFNIRKFAIVGLNDLAVQLVENIQQAPEMGLQFVGFYDDRDPTRTSDIDTRFGAKIGNVSTLVEQARNGEVHTIYITFPMRAEERIRHVLDQLSDSTASVYLVPDFYVFQLLHSRWTNIGGIPAVSVFENPFYGVDGLFKRVLDIVATSVLLTILFIPMAFIACLVKWSSPGPVFFRQRRYGLDGREILVWKYRSMRVCENGNVVRQATRGDDRITPIGKILRSTSIDELPQLFNVLNGTMSLVGPRPHASAHNEAFRSQIRGYMLRHKVRPGITGLAQVNGWRGETDTLEKMQKRIECDHQYIREWSIWMDLKILFRTVFVVFSRENAY